MGNAAKSILKRVVVYNRFNKIEKNTAYILDSLHPVYNYHCSYTSYYLCILIVFSVLCYYVYIVSILQ